MGELLLLASLGVVMNLASPVCHSHYLVALIPLFMGLIANRWDRGETSLGAGLWVLTAVTAVALGVPLLPEMFILRDFGAGLYASLLLLGVAGVVMWRRTRPVPLRLAAEPPQAAAA